MAKPRKGRWVYAPFSGGHLGGLTLNTTEKKLPACHFCDAPRVEGEQCPSCGVAYPVKFNPFGKRGRGGEKA